MFASSEFAEPIRLFFCSEIKKSTSHKADGLSSVSSLEIIFILGVNSRKNRRQIREFFDVVRKQSSRYFDRNLYIFRQSANDLAVHDSITNPESRTQHHAVFVRIPFMNHRRGAVTVTNTSNQRLTFFTAAVPWKPPVEHVTRDAGHVCFVADKTSSISRSTVTNLTIILIFAG